MGTAKRARVSAYATSGRLSGRGRAEQPGTSWLPFPLAARPRFVRLCPRSSPGSLRAAVELCQQRLDRGNGSGGFQGPDRGQPVRGGECHPRCPPIGSRAPEFRNQALVVELDVTDAGQRASAVRACHDHFDPIDVLVNSAGTNFRGAIEEQMRPITEQRSTSTYLVPSNNPARLAGNALPTTGDDRQHFLAAWNCECRRQWLLLFHEVPALVGTRPAQLARRRQRPRAQQGASVGTQRCDPLLQLVLSHHPANVVVGPESAPWDRLAGPWPGPSLGHHA